ncbi:MAG: hypothetical protein GNW80_12480 [Asgard group archaeon]|nr:hypothetical protein [Asgard group archaeon]
MTEIPDEKKKELHELVEKQKKAKINWVAVITQLSEEDIKTIAWEIGLVIDKDQIMLPTETEEGKKEKRIQKNTKKIIDYALNERVLRNYIGGGGQSSGYTPYFSGAGDLAIGLAFAGIAVAFAGAEAFTKSHIQKEFGNVETSVCWLDGGFSFSVAKADEMVPVKDHLFQDMRKQYDQNFHYLVPIKQSYELVVIPRNEDKLENENQKKKILSFCEILDNKIGDFCGKIVEQSVTVIEEKRKKVSYSVLLTSGVRAESTKEFINLNKYSLYLSYRTHLNQLYHELVQTKHLPNLVEFVLNNLPNQYQLIEKHIQYLFLELSNRFESWDFKENVKIIQSILHSL